MSSQLRQSNPQPMNSAALILEQVGRRKKDLMRPVPSHRQALIQFHAIKGIRDGNVVISDQGVISSATNVCGQVGAHGAPPRDPRVTQAGTGEPTGVIQLLDQRPAVSVPKSQHNRGSYFADSACTCSGVSNVAVLTRRQNSFFVARCSAGTQHCDRTALFRNPRRTSAWRHPMC